MILRALLLCAALTALAFPARAEAPASVDFQAVVAEIKAGGDAAIAAYTPEDGLDTGDRFSELYFDVFEASGMEVAVGMNDPTLKTELESLFGKVIGLASRSAPRADVEAAWTALHGRLAETAQAQAASAGSSGGFWATFVQSLLILVREGVEAMLVVTALIAYLARSDHAEKVRVIWYGVGWALAASLVTAWLMTAVFRVSGASREALEGVTMLVAAAVLFYVSYWLLAKSEAARWQAYIKSRIDDALTGGRLFALGFAAFLAVYREGAETVLFYQALVAGAPDEPIAVWSGFAVAAVLLVVGFFGFRAASFKLPLGVFFTGTAVLLYYMAFVFAGKGVLELQEARWLPITPIEGWPSLPWLGVFPTEESVIAQLVIIIPMLMGLMWWVGRRRAMMISGGGDARSH